MSELSQTMAFRRYHRLLEISRDIASTVDLEILLRRITLAARELVKAEAASILLFDPVHNELHFQNSTDEKNEPIMRGMVVPMESIAGYVATHQEPVIVQDAHADPRHFNKVEQAINFKTQSMVAVPVIAKDQLIGVLETVNRIDGTYNDEDVSILNALSAQAAMAIETARLYYQTDLVSELVHDLRTPLTSISAIAYLLERTEVPEEERIRLAHNITEEARRLNEMSTTFLDLARLESGRAAFNLAQVDVRAMLAGCVEIIRPRATEINIDAVFEANETLPRAEVDAAKLKQVIMNLLSNALKYNRPNGFIKVKAWANDADFFFSVKNTGLGISPEDLPHIFTKFYRAKFVEKSTTGTGLGLSICKRIVETHGGNINVESKLGEGATFTVRLPQRHTSNH